MKARSSLVVAAGVLTGLAVTLACITFALVWETHSLRRQLAGAAEEAARMRARHQDTQQDLAAHRVQLDALANEVASLKEAANSPSTEDAAAAVNARRARIFAGNRLVGLGWVVTAPTSSAGDQPAGVALANVMLDASPAGVTPPPQATPESGPSAPGGAFAYQYRYETYPYWPYLYTSGWVQWPWCSNSPPFDGVPTPPLSQDARPSTPAPPTASAGSPAPILASMPGPSPAALRNRFPTPTVALGQPRAVPAARTLPAPAPTLPTSRLAPAGNPIFRSVAPAAPNQRVPIGNPGRFPAGTRR
jgi:hypothetical protein